MGHERVTVEELERERRITVEMGLRAYKQTGYKPERGVMIVKDRRAACGLGVVYVACGGLLGAFEPMLGGKTFTEVLGSDYREGFAFGFDSYDPFPVDFDLDRAALGFEDGRALWRAVRAGVPELEEVPS